jgi:hypothetical protein
VDRIAFREFLEKTQKAKNGLNQLFPPEIRTGFQD